MVIEYLEKSRDMYLQDQAQLREKEIDLQNRVKENVSLIQMLEETNDPNYASFTPRDVNQYNKKKIEELRLEQRGMDEELNKLKLEMSEVDCRIDEINSVIKVAKKMKPNLSASGDNRFYILETQERERQRIARDLHDSTVQNLTALVHKSELCMNLVNVDPVRCKLELNSISKILRDVIDEARNLIYDLRPMSFDDIGFDVTVERFLDKIRDGTTVFNYRVTGEPSSMNSVFELTLLRLIQEGCSNAIKHGHASRVDIELEYCEDHIRLTIDDDGQGCDLSKTPDDLHSSNSGFGMPMMRERVYLLSGEIQVTSEPRQGFHIIITIPNVPEET
jgi:two-component system sensor histidine kinase DegS